MRSRSLVVLAILLMAGCTTYTSPTPTPTSIVPDHMVSLRAERARAVPVTIYGDNLAAGVEVDLKTGEVKFEGEFEARLGDVDLINVEPVIENDELVLKASVPGDMQPGSYHLFVAGPDGEGNTLPDAFEVRSIASVDLSASDEAPTAGARVTVTATILDSAGDPVAAELASDVVFSLDTGSGTFGGASLVSGSVRVPYDTADTPEGALVRATEQLSGADAFGTLLVDSRAGDVAGVAIEPATVQVTAGEGRELTAYLTDINGNPIPAAVPEDITFEVVAGNGTLGTAAVDQDVIKITYTTHTTAETASVRATEQVSGNQHTDDAQIQGTAGDPAQLQLIATPPDPVAGTATNVTSELQDQYGNMVPFSSSNDVEFTKLQGQGILGVPILVADNILVPYSTYRKVETSTIQGEVVSIAAIATVDITTIGGDPIGVTLEPDSPLVGAGTTAYINAFLLDANGNKTDASQTSDINVVITLGPGSLGAPVLEAVDSVQAVRVPYTAPNTIGQTVDFQATENVTGSANTAVASVDIVAGPVDRFDVQTGIVGAVPAGSPFNVTLTARDRFNNLADSFNAFVFVSDTTGTISPAISGDFVLGQRVETVTIPQTAIGVVIHVEDVAGHFGDSDPPFNVVGGGVDHFVIDTIADQVAGAPFDVTIRAMDELGNPVDTYPGPVVIQDTTGTVSPTNSGAFASGVRVESTRIFRADPSVVLSVDDGIGHTANSNPFAVSAGQPGAIVFVSPPRNVLRNRPSDVLQVQIQDGYGNPSPVGADTPLLLSCNSANCAFDTNSGGAFDGSVTSITIPAGGALGEFYFMDSFQGTVTITVSDPGAVLSPASQDIRVSNVGQPSQVVFVSAPATADAGVASQAFTVELQDAGDTAVAAPGNIVADLISSHPEGRFDTDSAGPFDGSITSATILTGTTQATFYYRDTRAGPADIDAVPPPNLVGDRASLDVLAGPVDHFVFDPIADQQAGSLFQVHIVAYDAFGNIADSFTGAVTLTDLSGTASPVASGSFTAGERTVTMTVTQTFSADVLTADDGSGHTGTSNPFNVQAGGVEYFTIDPIASPQNAGVSFGIHITARDAYDNIATQFIGVVDISDSTGSIAPIQSGTFTLGERDESVTVTTATASTMITVADGPAGHVGVSNAFEVLAGPVDHFAVGPVPAQVGLDAPFDVPMQALDVNDNVATSFSGTVSMSDLTGTLSPTTSGVFSAGLRTETVTVGFEINDDRINVDDGSGHTGFSNLFDVVAAQPVELLASLEFVPFAVIEGEGFSMLLHVDNNGDIKAEAVTPIDVALGGSGSATLLSGPTPAQTDIPGRSRATFTWTFSTGLSNAGWFDASARAQGVDFNSGLDVFSNLAAGSIPITAASCLLNPLYVSAGQSHKIACGESAVLGANPTAWGGVPAYSLDWAPDFALSATTVPNPTADPDMETGYRVVAFDQLGCSAVDTTRVILEDGPTAVATAFDPWACYEDWIQVDAQGSSGIAPLSYSWDIPGVGTGTGIDDWFEFDVSRGWYLCTLTVTDANGCRAQATIPIGRSSGSEPAGPVTFTMTPETAPADGVSEVTADSDRINECDGDRLDAGKEFHVLATRGTVVSADQGGADGIQVRTDGFGEIQVTIRADSVGGPGRLLVMTTRAEQESRGVAEYTFTGSTSLPRVADFGPSGHSDIAPPRFAVRFDKPMNPAATTGAIHLMGDLSGDVPGTASYDAINQIVFFAPDSLIDPANEVYTVTLGPSATDTFGNHLDGNYNGIDDGPADAFTFRFGALPDGTPPTVSCQGESKSPFTPDDDNKDDITEIKANLADDTALWLWRVEIFSPEGLPVRTLVALQDQNQNDVRLVWDGHDESGLLVDNARYDYRITAVDAAGNVSTSCTDSVAVDSVLDPAMFP